MENIYKRDVRPGNWEDLQHDKRANSLLNLNENLNFLGLKKQITSDSNILDIGSGKGAFSEQSMEEGFKNTISLDINPRSNNKSLNEVKARIERLPFADETLDLVHSQMCFDDEVYKQNQKQMMAEIARVLKKGGIYFSSEYYLNSQIAEECGLKRMIPKGRYPGYIGVASIYSKAE
ncbi:MAG: class I SAM-dependent methyltransferase [Candidatus Moraniibacteriota bacterium]